MDRLYVIDECDASEIGSWFDLYGWSTSVKEVMADYDTLDDYVKSRCVTQEEVRAYEVLRHIFKGE